jgi:hypothetical protein
VPRRYWFALVVADTLALLDKNLVNAHRFGLPWGPAAKQKLSNREAA